MDLGDREDVEELRSMKSQRCLSLGRLDLHSSTVDEQLYTGDVTCIVRGEEYGRLSNLFRLANPSQRHIRSELSVKSTLLLFSFDEATQTGRIDRSRA